MTTYEQVHAGAIVLGHDGKAWGVAEISAGASGPVVTMVRDGYRVTGRPPTGTEVVVLAPADVSAQMAATQVFIDAGFSVEILNERRES